MIRSRAHIASKSIDIRTAMAVMAARNLVTALQGKVPPNCVNPKARKKMMHTYTAFITARVRASNQSRTQAKTIPTTNASYG